MLWFPHSLVRPAAVVAVGLALSLLSDAAAEAQGETHTVVLPLAMVGHSIGPTATHTSPPPTATPPPTQTASPLPPRPTATREPAVTCANLVQDPSFESHDVPDESVVMRPPLPGWIDPLPRNGTYGITNILQSHGRNALVMEAEPDEVYALYHTRFDRIDPAALASAEVGLDIFIGQDFDFDEDLFSALIVNAAFPDCPGPIENCFESIGYAEDLVWHRRTLDVGHAVTRSDWSGFFLMFMISENHFSDSSLGLADNIEFRVCAREGAVRPQSGLPPAGETDLDVLRHAVRADR